jgi:hypothetical protein
VLDAAQAGLQSSLAGTPIAFDDPVWIDQCWLEDCLNFDFLLNLFEC